MVTAGIDKARAVQACKAALERWPREARFAFQYGRALEAAGKGADTVRWYRKAAEQGYGAAQHNLGKMYANSQGGLAKGTRKATSLNQQAAKQGSAEAEDDLALLKDSNLEAVSCQDINVRF